jgi:hypothetical protein
VWRLEEKKKRVKMSETTVMMKVPTFNGKAKEWLFYKAKIKAFMAKSRLTKILPWKKDIPKDDKTWASGVSKEDKEEEKTIQRQNMEAAGMLLQSISTDTPEGKAVFYQVEKYVDADEGYSGGNFIKAWEVLCKRYDETEIVDLVDIQQEYFDMKIEDQGRPSTFIVNLERMKKKLKDNGYKIEDADFIKQILAKLPKGKEDEVGPYQTEKRTIELQMKIEKDYDLAKLTRDLEKVYKTLNTSDEDNVDLSDGKEKALVVYSGQFKGRCHKCGKFGHKGFECKNGSSKENDPRFAGKCHYCGKVGHKVGSCFTFKKWIAERDGNNDEAKYVRGAVAF